MTVTRAELTDESGGGPVDAVVVGAGPNGLAAAITLAREGHSVRVYEAASTVGGGVRSAELTLPGYIHDVCSAIYPFGRISPFFRETNLETEGLRWVEPTFAIGHPLDDGTAVLLERDIDATAAGLGPDADAYRRMLGPIVRGWDHLMPDVLAPFHVPLSLRSWPPRCAGADSLMATAGGSRAFDRARAPSSSISPWTGRSRGARRASTRPGRSMSAARSRRSPGRRPMWHVGAWRSGRSSCWPSRAASTGRGHRPGARRSGRTATSRTGPRRT